MLGVTSGAPAVDILVAVAAGLTALGVIWRKGLQPIWRKGLQPIIRAAQKVNEALPVIVSIAEEFRPNGGGYGGGSLHDIITKMAADGEVLSEYAHAAKHETVNRLVALQGWQDIHGERLDRFVEETKTRFEELGAEVTTVKDDLAVVMTIIDRRDEPR